MKITNRDKNLLLIIFLILVCALYYQFFFTPQNAKLTELKQQSEDMNTRLMNGQAKIQKIKILNKNLEDEKKKILKIAQKYLVKVKQEDIILMINEFENKSSIGIEEITFTDPEDKGIILPEEKPQDGTADANQSANANQSADANKQQTKNNAQQMCPNAERTQPQPPTFRLQYTAYRYQHKTNRLHSCETGSLLREMRVRPSCLIE